MSFLSLQISRKVSTYLIPILSIAIFVLVVSISITNNHTDSPAITGLLTFVYLIPFLFGSMFVASKSINIFKDGEIDGTELLISSKKISRTQLVMGKFLVLYILLAIYSLFMFFGALAIGMTDKNASLGQVMTFAASMGIGSLIVNFLLSSFIILISSTLGRAGTIAIASVVPALVPIVSFILVPMGKGNGQTLSQHIDFANAEAITGIDGEGNVTATTPPTSMYKVSNNDISAEASWDKAYKAHQDGFYKYVAPFDIWEHLNGFFRMFQDSTTSLNSSATKWTKQTNYLDGVVNGYDLKINENHRPGYVPEYPSLSVTPVIFSISALTGHSKSNMGGDVHNYTFRNINIKKLEKAVDDQIASIGDPQWPENPANPKSFDFIRSNSLYYNMKSTKDDKTTPPRGSQLEDMRRFLLTQIYQPSDIKRVTPFGKALIGENYTGNEDVFNPGSPMYDRKYEDLATSAAPLVLAIAHHKLDDQALIEKIITFGGGFDSYDPKPGFATRQLTALSGNPYASRIAVILIYLVIAIALAGLTFRIYLYRDFK